MDAIKKIMDCRLCSEKCDIYFNLFEPEGQKMKIVEIILKHFYFEPKVEDDSHIICESCWRITRDFHDLYLLVEQFQKNNITIDIKEDPYDSYLNEYENAPNSEGEEASECILPETTCEIKNDELIYSNELKIETDDNSFIEEIKESPKFTPDLSDPIQTTIKKKRGRPRKDAIKSISEQSEKINSISEEKNDSVQEEVLISKTSKSSSKKSYYKKKNLKSKPPKLYKRSIEEIEALRKKAAEDDEIIAKFMKIYCNHCAEEQKSFTAYKYHCAHKHGEHGFIECCEKKFYYKWHFITHVKKHQEEEEDTICKICDHKASSVWKLKLHLRNSHQINDIGVFHSCSICSKAFKTKTLLKRHELVHVPQEERKFKCTECEKAFPSQHKLKVHFRICHEGCYSGICDLCGKKYKSHYELQVHGVKVHGLPGKQEKIQCKYCNKTFSSRYNYDDHKFREHENQNPDFQFKCKICDKVSPNARALKNHVQYVHNAKRKFECTICDKSFKRQLGLKEHMGVHTGESLYSCPHCPRTFIHSANMHHHLKLKHANEIELTRKAKDNKKESWTEYTSLVKT